MYCIFKETLKNSRKVLKSMEFLSSRENQNVWVFLFTIIVSSENTTKKTPTERSFSWENNVY
jgi:hypothetical protein